MKNNQPKLYINYSVDDDEAIKKIINAKINCDFFGPISEEYTPLLIYKTKRYFGLEGVKEFLEEMRKL